jgi:hypothetical protein
MPAFGQVVRLMQRRFQISTAAEVRLRRLPYLIDARPHAEPDAS